MTTAKGSGNSLENEPDEGGDAARLNDRVKQAAELGSGLFFIVLGGVVLWETRNIPHGVFEPLGAAPIPRAVAGIVVILAAVMLAERWWRRSSDTEMASTEAARPRLAVAGGFCILTLIYAVALSLGLVSYALATTGFVVVASLLLNGFRPMGLIVGLLLGLVAGFGLQTLFTQLFVVDLPTG